MKSLISEISALLPANWNVPDLLILGLILALGLLILGWLFRLLRGKESDLNQGLATAVAIVFLYGVSAIVYSLIPDAVSRFLSALPLVSFQGDYLVLFPVSSVAFPTLCSEILSMIVLAFLFNLADSWIPDGEKVLSWYLYRFLAVALAIALHSGAMWCFHTLLPGAMGESAPMILLGILGSMLLIGVLKVVLGVVLTIANPIIGAIYAFFFSHKIGKQLSKAVMTTILLTLLVLLLNHLGFSGIHIAAGTSPSYLLMVLALLTLWYLTGHIL